MRIRLRAPKIAIDGPLRIMDKHMPIKPKEQTRKYDAIDYIDPLTTTTILRTIPENI